MLDIIVFFKEGKRWIVSSTILSLLAGGAYLFLVSPKYEASASIQMASVAGTPVESPAILAEKLKLPLYYSDDSLKACDVENKLPTPGEYLAMQLKPVANKNAPIVSIRFRGKSAKGAQACLESVLGDIRNNQYVLLTPALNTRLSQFSALQQKLESTEKLITLLPVKDPKFFFRDPQFAGSALLLATLLTKENELKELRSEINEMQIALAEPQTRGTTPVTAIYAPNVKVAPKPALVLLASALGGIFLGIVLWTGRKFQSSKAPISKNRLA